jgi:hypothetical protein
MPTAYGMPEFSTYRRISNSPDFERNVFNVFLKADETKGLVLWKFILFWR